MENGDFYSGAWKEGIPHGRGYYKWADGSFYTGPFEEGKMHGHGAWRDSDGSNRYVGFFEDGSLHGRGTFISLSENKVTEGYWKNGLYVGENITDFETSEKVLQERTKSIVTNNAKSQNESVPRKGGENSPILSAIAAAIFAFFVYLFAYGRPKKKKEEAAQEDVSYVNLKEDSSEEKPLKESNESDSKEIELQRLKDLYDKDLITKEVYESRQLDILKDNNKEDNKKWRI